MRRERLTEDLNSQKNQSENQSENQQKQETSNDNNKKSEQQQQGLTYYFFNKDDLVWLHPKRGYPLWPAEVQEMNPKTHVVSCKLISAPEDSMNATTFKIHASKLYFFDRFSSQQQMDQEIEKKLQRDRFDVSGFEATFRNAVRIANRLASCPMTPAAVRQDMRFVVAPVGVVYSPFRSHCDAPRQPHTGATQLEQHQGIIRVVPELATGLQDVKGFEWIWVLFHFSYSEVSVDTTTATTTDENNNNKQEENSASTSAAAASSGTSDSNKKSNTADGGPPRPENNASSSSSSSFLVGSVKPDLSEPSTAYSTLIIPPRDTKKRGVFATRTPHRPNFIGLSCVRVLDVRGCDIHITDHDLLHGTPILDIKPYLPFCDSHVGAKAGWVDALNRSGNAKGDHRPAGTTDYSVVRARGVTVEDFLKEECK